jgi:DNA (cytosine-5)-methyltransferase 1
MLPALWGREYADRAEAPSNLSEPSNAAIEVAESKQVPLSMGLFVLPMYIIQHLSKLCNSHFWKKQHFFKIFLRYRGMRGKHMGLTFIDFFCGFGTIRMGMEKANHKCTYSVEWDKIKRKIYSIIFGGEPEGADIRTVHANNIPVSDVWCFGFPCTDISIAGEHSQEQLGLSGDRSGLFYEVMRLLEETRQEDRPKYLFAENVKNLLSINSGWDFLNLLYCLDEVGYDAEWDVINAADIVSQNRERTFIIGHLRGRNTTKVFPIRKSLGLPDKGQEKRTLESANLISTITKKYGSVHSGGETYIASKVDRDTELLRFLTPKESWRAQGVSDEIIDKVINAGISKTAMHQAAGDACNVDVIYEIAKKLT